LSGWRSVPRERRDRLGEGPLWAPRDNALYWTDILDRRLNRLDLATSVVETWEMPDTIGWIIEREQGGFVAGLGRRIVSLELDPLEIRTVAEPEPERDGNRLNDAKADPEGRIWAGSMPLGGDHPTGALYRLDPDGRVARVDDGYMVANGPALSPDGGFLYHADSGRGVVYRFPLEAGRLAFREPFIRFEPGWGAPDGMTCDADGGLWIAHWGGGCVSRFDPAGARERSIALPASQITSCAFAGEDLDRMFVTSARDGVDEPEAGRLFEVDPGCCGLPTHRYGG
jgi:sugar lactone lactonase YvrE